MILERLAVRDAAVIRSVDVVFAPGFNVLTGETGAGKSVLLQALAFVLGGRADPALIRTGAKELAVDAVFRLDSEEQAALGLGAEVVLSRELRPDGETSGRIDGRPVAARRLREVGRRLAEIVGQGEGFLLRDPEEQVALLDRFAGTQALVAERERRRRERRLLRRRLERLGGDPERRRRELDRLAYELAQIEEAHLVPGEEEELRQRLRRLSSRQEVRRALETASELLGSGGRPGAVDLLARATAAVAAQARDDDRLAPWLERAEGLLAELEELRRDTAHLLARLADEEGDPEAVLARLERIGDLRRRFGGSVADVLAYAEAARGARQRLLAEEQEAAALAAALEALAREEEEVEARLAALRRAGAERFVRAVGAELAALRLPGAELVFREAPRPHFLFRANPGEKARALGETASGGELHRLVLAAAVVARPDRRVMVFDEVDTGVGGEAARAVAERLDALARQVQLVVVTHQAVLAARADRHLCAVKRLVDGRAEVTVEPLDEEGRLAELARMLSGRGDPAALRHARALLAAE